MKSSGLAKVSGSAMRLTSRRLALGNEISRGHSSTMSSRDRPSKGPLRRAMRCCLARASMHSESFVLTSREAVERAHRGGRPEKITYWLKTKAYEGYEFHGLGERGVNRESHPL